MTKTILLALLALAMATEASAQSRTFYDSAGQRHRPLLDRQQRHGHELR